MTFSARNLFLIGFISILLVGIPVTIYYLQQQQETRSRAQKSTVLKFAPDSSAASPIQKNIGDSIPLDIMVDPGVNLASFVKLQIKYDTDKLATASSNAFSANTVVFPTVLEGPIYSDGEVDVTLSVGPDPTKAVQSLAKAGTVTFKALAVTNDGQPTLVTYGVTTQVLSIGSTDQASENVLSSTVPAAIAIASGAAPTATLTPAPTGGLTGIPLTSTPTPTLAAIPTIPPTITSTPTTTPTGTPTSTPTGTISGTLTPNQVPVCNSLAVDRATTGVAPFAITFTVNGSDPDGTISKVNINFGDGAVSGDITNSGGVGTNTVNVQTSHNYENAGTFTASGLLTDNSDGVSSASECQQTIIVQAGSGATSIPGATSTATPTLAATGSFGTALGIGAAVLFFILGGGLLFFVL